MSLADALIQPHDLDGDSHEGGEVSQKSQQQDAVMADLFGEGDDAAHKHEEEENEEIEEAEKDDSTPDLPDDGLSSSERKQRQKLEYEEEDEGEPEVVHMREAHVSVPKLPTAHSSDGRYWVIRMPNFVKIDSKPFHPDTYVGPDNDDDESQQLAESVRERSMTTKLEVQNTVRWRWVKDQNGNMKKQSNSRIIRWSDGSLSLQLGKELFDIAENVHTSGSVSRSVINASSTQSQSQSQSTQAQPVAGQGLTYLVAQHRKAGILQCEALITGSLSLRPTGMQSETHRKLVRAVGQKHNRVARLRLAPDPEKDLERVQAEALKNAMKNSKKKTRREKSDDGLGRKTPKKSFGAHPRRRKDEVWSDDEEEEYGGTDDDDERFDGRRKVASAKKSSEEKRGGEYLEDDFVVADSDEDSDNDKRRKKGARDDDDEVDVLAEAEAQLERRQKESAKAKKSKPAGSSETPAGNDDDEEMDVESEEEDEDEPIIRKPAPGKKRKVAAIDDDDDDE